jgi:hypothetical protein
MNEQIWDKFLTERDKTVFAVRRPCWLWQAAGVTGDRRQLGILPRAAGTHPGVDQALA